MLTLWRSLTNEMQRLLIFIAAGLFVLWVAHYVTLVHRANQKHASRCALEVRLIRAQNPFVDRYLCPADPCLCRDIMVRKHGGE